MKKRVARGQEGLRNDARQKRREALGRLLRRLRGEREMVFREIADSTGAKIPFLCDVEHGKRPIGRDKLERILAALHAKQAIRPEDYHKVFELRGRLPHKVERYFLQHPEFWKGGESMSAAKKGAKPAAKKAAKSAPKAKKVSKKTK
jgi:transcriptional regulator with XRE-family HTH domain